MKKVQNELLEAYLTVVDIDNPNTALDEFPLFWMNGYAAYGLVSEYISLVRLLTQFSTSSGFLSIFPSFPSHQVANDWQTCVKENLVRAIFEIPGLVADLDKGNFNNHFASSDTGTGFASVDLASFRQVLAGLSVLGGFQEILRVGSQVRIRSKDNEAGGTVVAYTPGQKNASVVFDADETQTIHRAKVNSYLSSSCSHHFPF